MRLALVAVALACLSVTGCVSWWEHRELGDLYRQQTIVLEDARARLLRRRGEHARERFLAADRAALRAGLERALEALRDLSSPRALVIRDGEQKRDFFYVKDAVAATLHLAEAPAATLSP